VVFRLISNKSSPPKLITPCFYIKKLIYVILVCPGIFPAFTHIKGTEFDCKARVSALRTLRQLKRLCTQIRNDMNIIKGKLKELETGGALAYF
jgi:hypothetical protein